MSNGALAVFGPTALTPSVRSTIDGMGGQVKYITAPDIEHHIFLSEWAKAFPNAKVLGPEGLPEKREKNPETKGTIFHHIWTKANKSSFIVDADFYRDFEHEFVDGHGNKAGQRAVLKDRRECQEWRADFFLLLAHEYPGFSAAAETVCLVCNIKRR